MELKSCAKFIFGSIGLEIRKKSPSIPSLIKYSKSTLVLDVGANTGQFARGVREGGYKQKIVSFEPLKSAHEELVRSARRDPDWVVHERCAIGAERDSKSINRSANSVSSSLLGMLSSHEESASNSVYIDTELVPIFKLDDVIPQYIRDNERIYLKIDTQGYEEKVLHGALNVLPLIDSIQLELSIIQLYEDQKTYEFFVDYLLAKGFRFWGIAPGFADPLTGQLLQFDGFFYRI
jgi:FkbM family methyltransferase